MLPTQGPSVPETKRTFSSRVSWETKDEAWSKEVGQPRPSAFAVVSFYIRIKGAWDGCIVKRHTLRDLVRCWTV